MDLNLDTYYGVCVCSEYCYCYFYCFSFPQCSSLVKEHCLIK
jgi:hypothetical protein